MRAAASKVARLLRIKADRVFDRVGPAPTGKPGAPRKEGAPFKCRDETTHGRPDRTFETRDEKGQLVEIAAWDNLHFRQERKVQLSVMRVTRPGAPNKKGDPRLRWFIWVGEKLLALEKVVPSYKRRFALEPTFRFKKQDLRWEKARLGTPEQFELWSHLVSFVMNELVLAQPLNQAYLRPWESQVRKASPNRYGAGWRQLLAS